MMKYSVVTILLYISIGCKFYTTNSIPIIRNTNEKLDSIIYNFHKINFDQSKKYPGVIGVRTHKFCFSKVFEIWKINNIHYFRNEKIIGYFIISNTPVFIFDNNQILNFKENLSEIINKTTSYIPTDLNLLPATEYSPHIIYSDKKIEIFSINDTLFKYDDTIIFNKKLLEYTGNIFCY